MHGTNLKQLIESHGPSGFYTKVVELLNEKKLVPDDFSYYELADACGVLPNLRALRRTTPVAEAAQSPFATLLREANPGVGTSLFQVVAGELIGRKVIEGYEDDAGFIGDKLVTVMPSGIRNAKIAGFRAWPVRPKSRKDIHTRNRPSKRSSSRPRNRSRVASSASTKN